MSIPYGHFSHALNSTAGSGYVTGGATSLYFTIPWYSASYVDRLRIFSSTSAAANIAYIAILNNAAHTRYGDGSITEDYLYFDDSTNKMEALANYSAYYGVDPPLFVQEEYGRPYLYVKVELASPGASDDYYFVTAIGRKSFGPSYLLNDKTHVIGGKNYSVVLAKNTSSGVGNTIFDVTQAAISNAINFNSASIFNINNANDYVYIGSIIKHDHWEFQVSTASTNCGALSGEIWNGSAWSGFQVLDNTSSDGTNSMRFSGLVEGAGLASSTWATTRLDAGLSASLPTDPVTAIGASIDRGLTPPIGFYSNPPRFWARFKVASLSDTIVFKSILGIEEVY